jgi:hypothetical protein
MTLQTEEESTKGPNQISQKCEGESSKSKEPSLFELIQCYVISYGHTHNKRYEENYAENNNDQIKSHDIWLHTCTWKV